MPWKSSSRNPRARSLRAPLTFIDPCLPTVADKAVTAAGWIHEIKHDGYRMQIHVRAGRVRLYTMTGVDWTNRYPWIVQDVGRLRVRSAIIDAEAVCADVDGVTDFVALHTRCNDASVFAYAFDVLELDGADLRPKPLEERRTVLERLLKDAEPGIRFSEDIAADGVTIFEHACRMGLEGIVSKRLGTPYRSGRVRTWVKTKNKLAPAYLRVQEGL